MLMEDKKEEFFFGTDKDNMNIDEYLERINNITKYYYESCEKYKKRFYICCFIRIIASAVIPVISLASKVDWSTVCVSLLACMITISEAYVNVTRAYEKWTKYRDTCNLLWIEQRRFSMKEGVYADENIRVERFVRKCEALLLDEMSEWRSYIERAKEMGK